MTSQVIETDGHPAVGPTLDEPLVLVSLDGHVGPRLEEDLRPYCPAAHLAAYDEMLVLSLIHI